MKNVAAHTANPALELVGGEVRCKQCGFVFSHDAANWRAKAKVAKSDLYEAMGRYRVRANPAPDRKLVFREYFCPQCLLALDNDVEEDEPGR